MRTVYKKGLMPTAVEGKRGLYYVENISVISGGGKEKQQENGGNKMAKGQ